MRTATVLLITFCMLALAGCAEGTSSRSRVDTSVPVTVASTTPGTIPAGTSLEVRTNDEIRADSSAAGRTFSGVIAQDVQTTSGAMLIRRGSPVQLVILNTSKGGATSGGEVELGIQSITVDGTNYSVSGQDVEKGEGIGANRRTGEMVGGGAALGTLLGAIAGGGKGAAIGAVAGAAAGAGAQILTRGKELKIPAESVLTFRLDQDLRLARN
jgi:hypothetical protein